VGNWVKKWYGKGGGDVVVRWCSISGIKKWSELKYWVKQLN
jgi:hypothetical protein